MWKEFLKMFLLAVAMTAFIGGLFFGAIITAAGPSGVHVYKGTVSGISAADTEVGNGIVISLDKYSMTVDGCKVERFDRCNRSTYTGFYVPDPGYQPVLGSQISITCNVEPFMLFHPKLNRTTCEVSK